MPYLNYYSFIVIQQLTLIKSLEKALHAVDYCSKDQDIFVLELKQTSEIPAKSPIGISGTLQVRSQSK